MNSQCLVHVHFISEFDSYKKMQLRYFKKAGCELTVFDNFQANQKLNLVTNQRRENALYAV